MLVDILELLNLDPFEPGTNHWNGSNLCSIV